MEEFEWDKYNKFWGLCTGGYLILQFYLFTFYITFYLFVFVFRTGVGACIFSLYMYIHWVPGTEAR
jgi:hypothetical protein